MHEVYSKLIELNSSKTPFVLVTITDKKGSIPSNVGAKMIVTEAGLVFGTIGGGALEYKTIEYALDMLKNIDNNTSHKINWNLQKEFNMVCSGEIELFFDVVNFTKWEIVLFGAGHVAQALVNILVTLDCSITCFDSRQEWLDKLPTSFKIKTINDNNVEKTVNSLDKNSFVLVMTNSHENDFKIIKECVNHNFKFLGLMGSKSKQKWLKEKILEENITEEAANKIYCPVGLPIGNNSPSEIAISIAAQLLQKRDLCH